MPRARTIPNQDDIIELAHLNADIKSLTRKADAVKARMRQYADARGDDLILQGKEGDITYQVEISTRYGLDDDKIRREYSPDEYPDLYEQKINTGAVRMFLEIEGLDTSDYEKPQPNRYVTLKEVKA